MRASSVVLALVMAIVVVALYHLLVASPHRCASDESLREEIASLRAELERKPPQGAATLRKLIELETRLATVEAQGDGNTPSWTAQDLEQLRSMLEALRESDRVRRSHAQLRTRLTGGKVGLSEDQITQLTPMLLRYTDSLLAARERARQGVPPSERFRGAVEAHARMCADVRVLLPEPDAEKVIELFPAPTAPPQPAPATLKKIEKGG